MKIYNSYTNQLEQFQPLKEKEVSIYVCGPTTYDYIHIGNARPVIFFDVVRRYFEFSKYRVKFVSNITDVDDKIIKKAMDNNVSETEITDKYINAFFEDVKRLGSSDQYEKPHATDYINEIIHYVDALVKKGFAYNVDGDVYFRVNKIKEYGALSNRDIENLISGSRVEVNNQKENPADFSLWKKTDVGVKWDSPFGEGRPGWHTECVCMIDDVFGGMIDIHGGGVDLKFPHHENEIVQSMALHGHRIATYWMHNGRLNIDSEKMSKSLGNVIKVKDLKCDMNAFRLYTLSTHYRSPINFTMENLAVYEKEWDKIQRVYRALVLKLDLSENLDIEPCDLKEVNGVISAFKETMDQDFNTANVITCLQDLVKIGNQMLRQRVEPGNWKAILDAFNTILNVMGLSVEVTLLTKEGRKLYRLWEETRKNKEFEQADEYRRQLVELGML